MDGSISVQRGVYINIIPENDPPVVAVIDNEATVKRYYKKSKNIELHPANSSMKPIIVKGGNFQIKGILVGLIRAY